VDKPDIEHLWRGRSAQFIAYLETLPPEERQRITQEERAFVSSVNAATSRQNSLVRDYAKGMLGVREGAPLLWRRFTV
jgi:hypothetical protein